MLDDNSHSVASWFDQHLETLIGFLVLAGGWIAGYVRQGVRLSHAEAATGKLELRLEGVVESAKVDRHALRDAMQEALAAQTALWMAADREIEARGVAQAQTLTDLIKTLHEETKERIRELKTDLLTHLRVS